MTHFATADEDTPVPRPSSSRGSCRSSRTLRALAPGLVVHAANSAATLRAPASHFDMVRCGIAIYGGDPMNEDPSRHGLEPALELSSYVAAVKPAQIGDSVGYGRRFVAPSARPGSHAADRIRRRHSPRADQQLRRDRRPVRGIRCRNREHGQHHDRPRRPRPRSGSAKSRRSSARQGPAAGAPDGRGSRPPSRTINYEILCGISERVPRALPPRRRAGVSEPLTALTSIVEDRRGSSAVRFATGCWAAPTADYDVVVAGDPRRLARALGAGCRTDIRSRCRRGSAPGVWSRTIAAGRSICFRSATSRSRLTWRPRSDDQRNRAAARRRSVCRSVRRAL